MNNDLIKYTEMLYYNNNFIINLNINPTDECINFLKTIKFIQRPKILIESINTINKLDGLLNISYGIDKNQDKEQIYNLLDELKLKQNNIILFTDTNLIRNANSDINNTYILINNINEIDNLNFHLLPFSNEMSSKDTCRIVGIYT